MLQTKVFPAEPVNVNVLVGLVPDGVGEVMVGSPGAVVSISSVDVRPELLLLGGLLDAGDLPVEA